MRVGELIKILKRYPKDRNIVIGLKEMDFYDVVYSFEDTLCSFTDGKKKCLLVSVQRPAQDKLIPKDIKFKEAKETDNGRNTDSGNDPGNYSPGAVSP